VDPDPNTDPEPVGSEKIILLDLDPVTVQKLIIFGSGSDKIQILLAKK